MIIPEKLSEKELIQIIEKNFELTQKIKLALIQAKKSHENQKREDGEPYLTQHIYPVTKLVIDFFKEKITEEIIVISLLHDALEDDERLTKELFVKQFGENTYKEVKSLSKPSISNSEKLTETQIRNLVNKKYFDSLFEASFEIKVIKLIDRINNLYWAMTFGEELVKIYIKETEGFFLPLAYRTDGILYLMIKDLLHKLETNAKRANWI